MSGLGSVLMAGGGTAGHVSPMLALADTLRQRDPGLRVACLGTVEGLEARLVPARGYELIPVPKVPLPRKPSGALLRLPGNLRAAVRRAEEAIARTEAGVVVGFGGYVSTPAYLAARRRGVPIVIHEQNARPGLANRLGARFATRVGVTFPATPLRGGVVTGMPLRQEIAALDRAARRGEAFAHFGLDPQWPTVLVTGGSLGAARINAAFRASVDTLTEGGVQVLHITGRGKTFEPHPTVATGAPYAVVEYCDRMDLAYAAADLVVARAGAGTVCELTAVGLPGVYVPLPIGNGEQRLNAAHVIEAGGGILVDDASMTAGWVTEHLLPLVRDPERLHAMAHASSSVGVRDGADRLAALVDEACTAGRRGGR